MNTTSHLLPTLTALIRERLASLEATKLPAAAMAQIERDVLTACRRAVERAVTAPRVGRAVAAALAATADSKGRKGADAPLPSSGTGRNAQDSVAGTTYNPADNSVPAGVSGVSSLTKGEVA